jgi:hypothetical protein
VLKLRDPRLPDALFMPLFVAITEGMEIDFPDYMESGRFRGVWRLRLMRAVTVRAARFVITLPPRSFLMNADPRKSPALQQEGIEPTLPWLYGFQLDFRFR